MRVSVDGASWVGWDFGAIRCADSSRAFVVGRTFHADSLAERLFRENLELHAVDPVSNGYGGGVPVVPRGVCAYSATPYGLGSGWERCAEIEPHATPVLVGLLSRRFDDTGSVVPETWKWPGVPGVGGMNFRARADFLNPTTVFSVVQRNAVVGRLRRAHLVGGLRAYRCPCYGCIEGGWEPDGEASENVFAQVAHDPVHCALFGRTWTGLWYFVDGKTGAFHDVVIPDTAIEWKPSDPGWIGFPRWIGFFVILAGIVLVALAIRSFAVFPARWGIKLTVAVLSLVAAWLVPMPHPNDRTKRVHERLESMSDMYRSIVLSHPAVPYRTTDSGLVCGDRNDRVVLSLAGSAGGRLEMVRANRLTESVKLGGGRTDSGKSIPIVAWDSLACSGFAQTGPKTFVQFDALTGRVRSAYLRAKAHFFSWPDTTPEVPKWWRDHLLLPPGREPDILLLPPPPRLELPLFLWKSWIRLVLALLLASMAQPLLACRSKTKLHRIGAGIHGPGVTLTLNA